MPRDQIEALQLRKLKNLVAWTQAQVPWHAARLKAAGVTADSIRSVRDLRRIPLMTRDEWMQAQLEKPPFGPLLAAPEDVAIRYHRTSGTTGRIPLQVLDSMKDWEWIAEMWCYGFWGFGVRPADIVFFAFSYGTFVGFWGAHYACEKIGCLVLPGGNMTTEARVKQTLRMKATVVGSTPTYALRSGDDPGVALSHPRPGGPRASERLYLRPQLRHLRGRHSGSSRRHEARARHQRLSARRRVDRPRVQGDRRVPHPPLYGGRTAGRDRGAGRDS